ncbi:hypothetical protein K466DRAFT_606095 [Polyporus arcularius HHB13444]|uniref:Uncharacterized protein n=1 Tax=Polyporus arcularius HHB13444 TaxID=1314778 RepID=A0A5C3NRZ2_9APHY|nr:hypothetical protein K466DRAFT_606095 [Polyporus arcularius HHB13444]
MSDDAMSSHSNHSNSSDSNSMRSDDDASMRSDDSDDIEPWVDLYNGKEMILTPFQDFAATLFRFQLVWAVENKEGTQTRHVLCHRRQGATPPGRQAFVPLLLDHFGEVARDGCFFTRLGIDAVAGRAAEEIYEAPMATCWFQQRPHDKLSIINWRPTSDIVRKLTNTVPGTVPSDVDTSMLFRNRNGIPQLKLRWQGFPGETTAGDLPIYNEHGIQQIPASLNTFPFAQGFHAGFTFNMHHDGDTDSHTVYANLLRIVRA